MLNAGYGQTPDDPPVKRMKLESDGEHHLAEGTPSNVIRILGIHIKANEADIIEALRPFGNVAYILIYNKSNEALAEFQSIEASLRLMEFLREGNVIHIFGHPVECFYGQMKMIERHKMERSIPGKTIVLSTKNVGEHYLNTDVFYRITKDLGDVQRMVVVHRPFGVQAMIEFATTEQATTAKYSLNGCDIYSGACTLRAEYFKEDSLHVKYTDDFHRDYVKDPIRPAGEMPINYQQDGHFFNQAVFRAGRTSGFSQRTVPGPAFNNSISQYRPHGAFGYGCGVEGPGQNTQYGYFATEYNKSFNGMDFNNSYNNSFNSSMPTSEQSPVVVVYGLDHKIITCQMLFNVFCVYGNVYRVRFVRRRDDMALVQMGSNLQAKTLMKQLKDVLISGLKLNICPSNHAEVVPDLHPFEIKDKTLSYMDFTDSRNQRYMTPEQASRNRPIRPTKSLHFFNAPPAVTETTIQEVLAASKASKAVNIYINQMRPGAKGRSGFIEFGCIDEAVDALALVNHTLLPCETRVTPFTWKLDFCDGDPSKLTDQIRQA